MRRCVIICALFLVGCTAASQSQARGRVITTLPEPVDPLWTADELAKPIAVRPLRRSAEVSVSLIRLAGAEQPHIHRNHDLVVMVLSGRARLHLGDRTVEVRPGDVMEIPRGAVHWAENTGPGASEVYAIFSPPYDGRDNLPVPPVPLPKP
jgi:mannose-6-phosphate isomerase-like protein (cupin superfamily)